MDLGRADRETRLQQIAAEYALGTLASRARRRLAREARRNARVATAIASWEQRLGQLALAATPVAPSPRVWNGIVKRLGISAQDPAATSWWTGLRFWRGLAVTSALATIGLGVAHFTAHVNSLGPSVVVVLAGGSVRPAWIATTGPDERELTLKAVAPATVPPDRALELWALPEGLPPRSLGVIPSSGTVRMRLAPSALERIPALAISLEPAGGSPTGAPTGPVLYTGRIERI
ncbi:MAG TPA: anti-sigma factor [Casimicrobiaceae bacterium]|nr:anti-sigma factor [Casimicrobiaceae bacterium]